MEWAEAANTIWQCRLQRIGVVDLPCSFRVDDPDLTQTSYKLTFDSDRFSFIQRVPYFIFFLKNIVSFP